MLLGYTWAIFSIFDITYRANRLLGTVYVYILDQLSYSLYCV
nr:MAG TPA: hypothetical protein [Crassvirales sp.]